MTKKKGEEECEGWVGLDTFILGLSQDIDPSKNYAALKIMVTLFTYVNDKFSCCINEIYNLFKKSFESR